MKYIFLLCLALPLFSLAQTAPKDSVVKDCKLIREVDPYTREKKISTGFIPLEGGKINFDVSKAEVDLLFSLPGADKCFSDASNASIFFAGSKLKQTQRNNGSMNCEGLFHFIFRNGATPALLMRKLATMKVEKIIFIGNDKKETTVTLTPEQQEILMDLAACVNREGALLLQ
jgi:hypothetical protein